jgi:hypothetical protein
MRRTLRLLAAITALAVAAAPADADACGGIFCSSSPVNQNAERVLFIRRAEGDTTAVVQVQLQGNDPDFAWVVPVDAVPRDIHEENTLGFIAMDARTAPTYRFPGGFSGVSTAGSTGCFGGSRSVLASAAEDTRGAAVRVWASGETGNFHYDVVSSENGDALFTWLNDNRYRTPEAARPIVAEYVTERKFFLALRLHAPQGVPQFLVSPVAFTYAGDRPCVPIRLTRIATAPSLPVLTYVIAAQRAVPMNYTQTEVEDRAVAALGVRGWQGGAAYDGLVSAAVREAGGRAWVTEFAAPLPEDVRAAFSTALQERMPARPYLTRFYTTISAERMDRDPEFVFVPGLPDVSNVHDLSRFAAAGVMDLRALLASAGLLGLARLARRRRRA